MTVKALLALGAAAVLAATRPARADDAPAAEGLSPRTREKVIAAARRRLGRPFRGDCSGFVLGALRAAGVSPQLAGARSRSESLFRASRRIDSPRPGDLAFFHDTYDRNHDGRANDPFTHVALVEAIDDGAIVLLHRGKGGVERFRMDLARPSDPDANDLVRAKRPGDAPATRFLAGELFAAFGELLPHRVAQMLQASPASDTDAEHPATDERP